MSDIEQIAPGVIIDTLASNEQQNTTNIETNGQFEHALLTQANVNKMLNEQQIKYKNQQTKNSFGNMSTESMDGSYCSAAAQDAIKLDNADADNVPIQSRPRNAG